ncbi:hypothetical protein VTK73DRAFT_3591 [Phialemonium thermophilum]|uniref:Nitrogen regulatory protein areA GATA-like domain-containing protein n=1 Tax=Phialemonium thermophilum TaxID=223376 RepID=A0ABR3WZ34_9PEZI
MPASLRTPVLQVDANVIHKVDTRNPDNLFSMWTVFARCADSVAQGRRLENLSWRLWTRETFCCEGNNQSVAPATATLPKEIVPQNAGETAGSEDLPQLSGSVDSVADEEAVEFTSESTPMEILRPRIRRQDSCASSRSRGKERHITSDDLEKMVVTIIQAKEPLDAPFPEVSCSPPSSQQAEKSAMPPLERSGSTTTESTCKSSDSPSLESLRQAHSPEPESVHSRTQVVHGFSPSQRPISNANTVSQPSKPASPDSIPKPQEAPPPRPVQPKKPQPKFDLGGSSAEDSYSDRGRSLEVRKQPIPSHRMFQVGASSEEESSLKSALHSSKTSSLMSAQKKTASFSSQVVTRTYKTPAITEEDQSETDYVDESAIDDDDDSSEWEDSVEDSGKSSMDEKRVTFERVPSRVNLPSRRSLITLMLAQNDRSQRMGNVASQSTSALSRAGRVSPNGPSMVASPSDSDDAPLEMKRGPRVPPMRAMNDIPRSTAQPILTTHGVPFQAALSPRTTRRNMLATELTESLRRHLLWERSQKTSTANAVLKRRHTSHDVANLKQYPEKPYMKKEEDVNSSSWDQYFTKDAFTGYHSQGW